MEQKFGPFPPDEEMPKRGAWGYLNITRKQEYLYSEDDAQEYILIVLVIKAKQMVCL